MRARITVEGDIVDAVEEGIREQSRDLRDGVVRASQALLTDVRDQTSSAFKGNGVTRAWRSRIYPTSPFTVTLHPAAVVWTRAPNIVSAFEEGKTITARRGRYLCWPTGYNAIGGRRNKGSRGGLRVTPDEMKAAKGQSVIITSKSDRTLKLWCLRVRQASSTGGKSGRGRGRVRLFVGNRNVEVNTGRGKAGERKARQEQLVESGLVPMFFLKRSVNPGKRLDIAGAANRAEARLADYLE
jgi:uncharacterized protein YjlB